MTRVTVRSIAAVILALAVLVIPVDPWSSSADAQETCRTGVQDGDICYNQTDAVRNDDACVFPYADNGATVCEAFNPSAPDELGASSYRCASVAPVRRDQIVSEDTVVNAAGETVITRCWYHNTPTYSCPGDLVLFDSYCRVIIGQAFVYYDAICQDDAMVLVSVTRSEVRGGATLSLIRINGSNGSTAVVAQGAAISLEALTSNANDELTFFGPAVAPSCAVVEVAATATPQAAAPTAVTEATVVAEPSATPEPTGAPQATAGPEPTATPQVVEATAVPEPTAEAEPTAVPEPTTAAEPTVTPEPTAVPEPTAEALPDEPDSSESAAVAAATDTEAASGGSGIVTALAAVGVLGLAGAGALALRKRR